MVNLMTSHNSFFDYAHLQHNVVVTWSCDKKMIKIVFSKLNIHYQPENICLDFKIKYYNPCICISVLPEFL